METQEMLNTPIGNTDKKKEFLKPARVKIVNVEIVKIEKAKSHKVIFEVKHPDRDETIKISSMNFINNKNVINSGTWITLDEDNKIQKGSALQLLMDKLNVKTIKEFVGKECDTELDNNFLCFKAY